MQKRNDFSCRKTSASLATIPVTTVNGVRKELGVTLFTRGNRKITLTEDGLLFRKRAEEIVELLEKTRSEFLSPRDTIAGNVSIGAGETYVIQMLGKIIKEIQVEYPNVKFHLFSGNADEVKERLDKGLLDFGVVISPVDVKNTIPCAYLPETPGAS